jgi:hypothetical protein
MEVVVFRWTTLPICPVSSGFSNEKMTDRTAKCQTMHDFLLSSSSLSALPSLDENTNLLPQRWTDASQADMHDGGSCRLLYFILKQIANCHHNRVI